MRYEFGLLAELDVLPALPLRGAHSFFGPLTLDDLSERGTRLSRGGLSSLDVLEVKSRDGLEPALGRDSSDSLSSLCFIGFNGAREGL